jgi:hypothetical protein
MLGAVLLRSGISDRDATMRRAPEAVAEDRA